MFRIGMFIAILLSLVPLSPAIAGDTVVGPHCDLQVFGEKDKHKFQAFDTTFRISLKNNDPATLVSVVEFPLRLNYAPGVSVSIDTPATLQAKFQEAFPLKVRDAVLNEDSTQVSCGYDGVSYANGTVWVEDLGESTATANYFVIVVNLPQDPNAKLPSRKGRVDFVCNTGKHHIVVDEPEADKPRYRSWDTPHTVADKPDMQIDVGLYDYQGTGLCGHDVWEFKKGDIEFDVSGLGCYEDSSEPPSGAKGELLILIKGDIKQRDWCT